MQVLFNLLGNAQQALARLDRAGRIVVRAGTARRRGTAMGSSWTSWIMGPGIPEAFIDRIFEPFFTTRDDGTGYGLYLAAELLKEQSGRLTVVNNSRRGSHIHDLAPSRRIGLPNPTQFFVVRRRNERIVRCGRQGCLTKMSLNLSKAD